jgi:hypothetical protein
MSEPNLKLSPGKHNLSMPFDWKLLVNKHLHQPKPLLSQQTHLDFTNGAPQQRAPELSKLSAQKSQPTPQKRKKKHTAPGIRWSSPTQLLVRRLVACLWESGRDPEFSTIYGRMYLEEGNFLLINGTGRRKLGDVTERFGEVREGRGGKWVGKQRYIAGDD